MSAHEPASATLSLRPLLRLAVPLLCLFVLALSGIESASAHASLVRTDPADGAVLASAPRDVTLTFSESVTLASDSVGLFDARGRPVASDASASGVEVNVEVQEKLSEGSYVLTWRLVSADGHPISGSLTFAVGEPSSTIAPPGQAAQPGAGVSTTLQVVRTGTYLALFLAAGLILFLGLVLSKGAATLPTAQRLGVITRVSSLIAVLSAVATVPLTALERQASTFSALTSSETWQLQFIGDDLVVALVIGAGLAAGTVLVVRARTDQNPKLLRLASLGALVALAAPALTGHTRSVDPVALMIATDVVHLAAGAFWLGGVVGITVTMRLTSAPDIAATTVARFSGIAAGVLALLTLSGSVMAWRIIGSWSDLFGTSYGQLLIIKVGVVALAVLVAAWNRWVLLPRLAERESTGAARTLRRTLLAEVALLVGVLALTGMLTGRSPQDPVAAAPAQSAFVTGSLDADHEVLVLLTPQRVGPTTLHVHLVTPQGVPVEPFAPPVVSLSTDGYDLGQVDLIARGDGAYTAKIIVPAAGDWEVRTSVRLDEFANPVASVTVPVAGN